MLLCEFACKSLCWLCSSRAVEALTGLWSYLKLIKKLSVSCFFLSEVCIDDTLLQYTWWPRCSTMVRPNLDSVKFRAGLRLISLRYARSSMLLIPIVWFRFLNSLDQEAEKKVVMMNTVVTINTCGKIDWNFYLQQWIKSQIAKIATRRIYDTVTLPRLFLPLLH